VLVESYVNTGCPVSLKSEVYFEFFMQERLFENPSHTEVYIE